MPRFSAHYSITIVNHESGGRLKIELVDLPFAGARRYRVRVNGRWAQKVPIASKTEALRQLRTWLVQH